MHTSSTSPIYLLVIIIWSVVDIAKSGGKPNPAYFSPLFFPSFLAFFFPLLSLPINSRLFLFESHQDHLWPSKTHPCCWGLLSKLKPIYIIAGFLSHPGTCGHRIVAASRLEKQQAADHPRTSLHPARNSRNQLEVEQKMLAGLATACHLEL